MAKSIEDLERENAQLKCALQCLIITNGERSDSNFKLYTHDFQPTPIQIAMELVGMDGETTPSVGRVS